MQILGPIIDHRGGKNGGNTDVCKQYPAAILKCNRAEM